MNKDFKEISLEMIGADDTGGTCSTLADQMLKGRPQGEKKEAGKKDSS
ncbi:hypothetical protein [Thermosulfuriphilus sp.]